MGVKASAPGNIFFFGEHAAVYGRPAICAAVGRRTETKIRETKKDKIVINSRAFGVAEVSLNSFHDIHVENRALELIALFAQDVAARFKIQQGFELEINSTVPVNSGMSSSTAVFCSILGAISTYAKKPLNKDEYFGYVYPSQAKAHGGKASGSEIISSTFGGFNYIKKLKDGAPPEMEVKHLGEHKYHVVIGNTRVDSPTHMTVQYHVPSLIKRDADLVSKAFDKIGRIAESALPAIRNDDIETIGKLMNENQAILASLGLSHPKLDDCIKEATRAGALGAKLSGSGWGGIMFALCRAEDVKDVAGAIAKTGAEVIETEVGVEGILIKKSLF